jgi:hypothetical protein
LSYLSFFTLKIIKIKGYEKWYENF